MIKKKAERTDSGATVLMAADGKRGRTEAEAENRRRVECELEEKKEERLGKKGLLRRVIAEEEDVSAAIATRAEKWSFKINEQREMFWLNLYGISLLRQIMRFL